MSEYINQYLTGISDIINQIDRKNIRKTIKLLIKLRRKKGRLFIIGVGGAAANSSHAVNDFRKIAHIEAYTPIDNVSELTARTNDDGWETIFESWLRISKLTGKDAVMVLSVGGGNVEKNISVNIVKALDYAKKVKATILGIVSRDGGHTKKVADACVLVPIVNDQMITAYAESFQAIIWHLIVFSPELQQYKYWDQKKSR